MNNNGFKNTKKAISELDLSEETKFRLNATLCNEIDEEFNNIRICGKSLKEIIDILNGLEIERMTDIK